MTAGEIAAVTGLGRATVSTTLSKLATSGAITKAARGYQIPDETDAPVVEGAGETGSGCRVERHRCPSRGSLDGGKGSRCLGAPGASRPKRGVWVVRAA